MGPKVVHQPLAWRQECLGARTLQCSLGINHPPPSQGPTSLYILLLSTCLILGLVYRFPRGLLGEGQTYSNGPYCSYISYLVLSGFQLCLGPALSLRWSGDKATKPP